ncbi:hypothetical protein TNCV_2371351 [Trichonephila clavipes]|nr:hypothetical protein TNCV_2371351 [Trichonephila clavipes]
MLEKVIENWTSRLDYIRASRGSHMPEIIFKICRSSREPEILVESFLHTLFDCLRCSLQVLVVDETPLVMHAVAAPSLDAMSSLLPRSPGLYLRTLFDCIEDAT